MIGARGKRARWVHEAWLSLLFCGPAVILYAGFVAVPMLLGFAYSLTDWSGWTAGGGPTDLAAAAGSLLRGRLSPALASLETFLGAHFIGTQNYLELLRDSTFVGDDGLQSFRHSVVGFTLFETLLIVLFFTFFSMVLAVLLDRLHRLKGLIRGLFFYPYILSILVAGLLFMYLANYREGALNQALSALGLDAWKQDWAMGPNCAPYFIFALVAWSGLGFFTTLYLANLQTIPTDLYEAARIDGAGALSVFTRIQFPMLIPTVTTNSVLALITGINLFPQIVVTTEGGPGTQTFTIGYYIYYLGRLSNRQGFAAAVSFLVFVVLLVVAGLHVTLMRRRQVAL